MKKFITDIKTLAALLMAGAAFTACSSDDNTIDEQPVNPAKQPYTLTVKASKGGDATTRALTLTGEGNKTLKAYWDGTETVTVKEGDTPLGTLTVTPDATDNTQATLSGELDAAPSGTALTLELFSDAYNSQDGTLDYIASHCDYATATTTVTYDAVNKTVTGTDADFTNQQAIIKFTLKDKANDAAISPSALTVDDGTSTVELTSIPAATYTANGADNVLYVAFPAAGSAKTVTLTATVGDYTYTYEKSGVTFTNGQYYEITVKMTKQVPAPSYTMAADAADGDVGKLICTDGHIHAYGADAECTADRVAMIAVLGNLSDCENGLAIALEDVSSNELSWDNSGVYNDGKTAAEWCSAWNTSKAVTGGTWRLPSYMDWQYMFYGCEATFSGNRMSYSELASKLETAGGTALKSDLNHYWSSTENNPGTSAWYLYLDGSDAYFYDGDEYYEYYVRACLAF